MKLPYAHQVRPESDPLPFELRQAEVTLRLFPPDEIDLVETYQVIWQNRPISDAEINVETAWSQAAWWLMDQSRKAFGPRV